MLGNNLGLSRSNMDGKLRCIYCNSKGPFSKEHALPRTLGEFEGCSYLCNRVCKKCNEEIGQLEEQFGRSGPEAFFRKYLGIDGRESHDKINPFQRGSAGAKPIDFKAMHPKANLEVLFEFNPGEKTVREVRQVVFVQKNGDSYPIRIPEWMKDADSLRSKMKQAGINEWVSARIFASDEERKWVEDLVQGLGLNFKWLPNENESMQITNPVAEVSVTSKYFRAIAKIGFHYLLVSSNSFHGDEEYFALIRSFIIKGGEYKEFITQTHNPIVAYPHPNLRPKNWGHVLLVENVINGIQARLQFFLGSNFDPLVYLVQLTKEVAKIETPGWRGHYYSYFELGKKGKFHGEVSALKRGDRPSTE